MKNWNSIIKRFGLVLNIFRALGSCVIIILFVSALTKSHTHGSFVRTKMAEEGSDEWWASEKAKKLSPKRFDASEIQFKKVILLQYILIIL